MARLLTSVTVGCTTKYNPPMPSQHAVPCIIKVDNLRINYAKRRELLASQVLDWYNSLSPYATVNTYQKDNRQYIGENATKVIADDLKHIILVLGLNVHLWYPPEIPEIQLPDVVTYWTDRSQFPPRKVEIKRKRVIKGKLLEAVTNSTHLVIWKDGKYNPVLYYEK